MTTAALTPEDVRAIRSAATTEDERFWASALSRSMDVLSSGGRQILEAPDDATFESRLTALSRRPREVRHCFILTEALESLEGSTGTRDVLARAIRERPQTRKAIDREDAEILEAIFEGYEEQALLLKQDPGAPYHGVEDPILLDAPDRITFKGEFVVAMTRGIILSFAMAHALRTEPSSPGAKRTYRRLLRVVAQEVELLARQQGLGATRVFRAETGEPQTDGPCEPIDDSVLDGLLENYRRG